MSPDRKQEIGFAGARGRSVTTIVDAGGNLV
jgi:hypothetical protein